MPKMTGTEFAEKWGRRLKGAVTDIVSGVEKVTEAPGPKAAAKVKKWQTKMADPATAAKWANNTAAVPLEEWKATMIALVPQRLPGGVDKATPKVTKFGDQLLAYQDANIGKIKAMSDVTYAETKARMDAWFDIMTKFHPRR